MTLRTLAWSVASAFAASAILPASAACTAGQVDASFGPSSSNGFVQVTPWNAPYPPFEALAVGGDNKLYVGSPLAVDSASFFPYEGVIRASRGGAIDRTYGGAGSVVAGGQSSPPPQVGPAANLAIDASGNLLSVNATSAGFSISRFLPDGTPDVSYGTNGVAQVALTNPFWFVTLVALADGSAVIGTSATNPAASNPFQALFAKLTPSGALDSSFGSGGMAWLVPSTAASNAQVRMTDIALLPTGDIVGIGRLRNPPDGVHWQGFSTKIHADGSLDSTYGSGGFTIIPGGPVADMLPRKLALQPDNQVIAAGSTQAEDGTGTPTVMRFRTNGTLDTTFGTAGLAQFLPAPGQFAGNVTLQANNKIVVALSSGVIARLTTAGALDPAFGSGGTTTLTATPPLGGGSPYVVSVKASGTKIFASLTSPLNTSASSPIAGFLTAFEQGTGAGCR